MVFATELFVGLLPRRRRLAEQLQHGATPLPLPVQVDDNDREAEGGEHSDGEGASRHVVCGRV